MTDETTARDQADQLVADAIDGANPCAHDEDTVVVEAGAAVDALLAHPEVLRALAGALTADVADRCPSCEHRREFHSEPGCWYAVTVGTPDKPLNCPCTSVDWPAAPEGVDAADELPSLDASEVRRDTYPAPGQLAHESPRGVTLAHLPTGLVASCHTERSGVQNVAVAYRALRELVHAAAAEGVDAADEPRCGVHDVTTEQALAIAAAYDQRGDELTAAQAAIERVREKHTRYADGSCWECGQDYPCSTVRALDGDTTEECSR